MNPFGGMDTSNTEEQNRPSIFSEQYPPPVGPPNWNNLMGFPQDHMNYGSPPTVGYNMQPQGFPIQPNFQFNHNQDHTSQTIHFPFRMPHRGHMGRFSVPSMRCKRKTDSPPLQAAKQFITEEKMSEHLSKLQISSKNEEQESKENKEKRLYMCEAMRKFQAQHDPIIPNSLEFMYPSPCKALVLWQSPKSILAPDLCEEEDCTNNNNNVDSYNSVEQVSSSDLLSTDVEFEEL